MYLRSTHLPLKMSMKHRYRLLDKERKEIRLLHLEAGSEQRISGRIEYTSLLHDSSLYIALSYVWGAPNYTSSVLFYDNSYLPISHNLIVALQHVSTNGFAPVCSSRFRVSHKLCIEECTKQSVQQQVSK